MSDDIDGGGAQQEALKRLDQAVTEFQTKAALQALHDGDVLAGLKERLHIRWPSLRNEHDTHHIIAQAVDARSTKSVPSSCSAWRKAGHPER